MIKNTLLPKKSTGFKFKDIAVFSFFCYPNVDIPYFFLKTSPTEAKNMYYNDYLQVIDPNEEVQLLKIKEIIAEKI